MNAAKMTLTSTILAAALGLALGLAAAPAMADPPGAGGHNHGGGSGGEDATLYTVILDKDSLISTDPLSVAGPCTGTTDIQANPGLMVDFLSPGCGTVSVAIDEEFGLGSFLDLSLFRVEVKDKKSGTILRFYFTTQTTWAPHTEPLQGETIYASDSLSAVISFDAGPYDFDLIPGGAVNLALTKIHQPGKGAVTNGVIAVGTFHYTAVSP